MRHWLIFVVAGLALVTIWTDYWHRSIVIDRHSEPKPELLSAFAKPAAPDNRSYTKLFLYFLEGFEDRRSADGALAYYPGLPSRHGQRADALEGFSRSAPLWGAWVHSGRPIFLKQEDGRTVNLVSEFRRGLIAGTDPSSPEYWGDVRDLNQRIVEASDVALSLWLFRDQMWSSLSPVEQDRVFRWLQQSENHRVSDNNWHLFPVFIDAVLRSIRKENVSSFALYHYHRFKQFYRGDGWFSDGPGNVFDFYNAWAIHYQLFWLSQVDPNWDPEFIARTRREFIDGYKFVIGPIGLPIEGRSICYRMAAPAPLIIEQMTDPSVLPPAEARRALDATWSYFIGHRGLHDGNITQGYCGVDPRILDNYSGPASCLWGLRSLIIAFYNPPGSKFWSTRPGYLEVEKANFRKSIKTLGWTIVGQKATGLVSIEKNGVAPSASPLRPYGILRRIATATLWRPFRPDNTRAKYGLNRYTSQPTFWGCP